MLPTKMSVKYAAPLLQIAMLLLITWKHLVVHPPMWSTYSWSWLSPSPVATSKQTINISSCCLKQNMCGVQWQYLMDTFNSIIVWFMNICVDFGCFLFVLFFYCKQLLMIRPFILLTWHKVYVSILLLFASSGNWWSSCAFCDAAWWCAIWLIVCCISQNE